MLSRFYSLAQHLAVSACCGLLCSAALGQALPKEVVQALAASGVPVSSISVIVQALPTSGAATVSASAPVVQHHARVSVNPASVMKLITTYSALDLLGAQFTWKNRVYIDGSLDNGVLRGNLILRGSGDPKLVLERIDELFKRIQAAGVREVRGDIWLDNSVFEVLPTDPADFDNDPFRPYNAAPDGLLLNFKSLIFTFSPDATGQKALLRSEPPMADVAISNEVAPSYGSCGDWRSSLKADFSDPNRISFAGRYPLSCGEQSWPVAYVEPRQYAARVVQAMWREAGGQLTGTVRSQKLPRSAQLLLTADSLPMSEIIADVNKFSNNVMAQQVFLTLSSQLPSPVNADSTERSGSFALSRRLLTAWWKSRLPLHPNPLLDNGSGLSRNERSTAAALNALLQHAAASSNAQVFANSLGIAGVDGTVARMRERKSISAAIGQAQLKTGTLRDVVAIAGYANAQNGQRYSLVGIVNHPNASSARGALDALVEWTVRQR